MANKPWEAKQEAFRAALKRIREDAKLSQTALAEAIGKPQSYVSKYESGERKLDYLEVRAILEVCDSSIIKLENKLKKIL
jgi:transcriptional regulator with XRE-family HTH domain